MPIPAFLQQLFQEAKRGPLESLGIAPGATGRRVSLGKPGPANPGVLADLLRQGRASAEARTPFVPPARFPTLQSVPQDAPRILQQAVQRPEIREQFKVSPQPSVPELQPPDPRYLTSLSKQSRPAAEQAFKLMTRYVFDEGLDLDTALSRASSTLTDAGQRHAMAFADQVSGGQYVPKSKEELQRAGLEQVGIQVKSYEEPPDFGSLSGTQLLNESKSFLNYLKAVAPDLSEADLKREIELLGGTFSSSGSGSSIGGSDEEPSDPWDL